VFNPLKVRKMDKADFKEQYPKEIILKDGTGVSIRPLDINRDKAELKKLYMRFTREERWFLKFDLSEERRLNEFFKNYDEENIYSLISKLENRIIAHATVEIGKNLSRRHIGEVEISVDPAFRERYLGTWILFDIINYAIYRGLEILYMELIQGKDQILISGVEKLGFKKEGVIMGILKDMEGSFRDLYIMVKRLKIID